MVTADAAWQCRQNFTGVIMAGKAADLVILDKDPTRVDPSVAFRLNVVATAACRPANRISIDVRFVALSRSS